MKQIILDTDIGTDVDDSIALLQILSDLNDRSLFLTTVYGNTSLRSQIASSYIELTGCTIPVFTGEGEPLSKREIFYSGFEGKQFEILDERHVKKSSANEVISSLINENPETTVVAIGPLTNLAIAVLHDPMIANKIKHAYVMGGRFETGKPEHNILCDDEAAKIVFQSGIPITIIGIEQTQRLKITLDELEDLKDIPKGLGVLFNEVQLWCNFRKSDHIVPHDSLAVLLMTNPDIFTLSEPGTVSITENETIFTKSLAGKHQYVTDFDISAARELILKSLQIPLQNGA